MWGYIFTLDKNVVYATVSLIYVLAAYHPIDGLVLNFQGILVGIGEQRFGLIIPMSFFVVSIPVAVILIIVAKLGSLGYWLGMLVGFIIRAISMLLIAFCWINRKRIITIENLDT